MTTNHNERRNIMTNPLAIITLHAVNAYHNLVNKVASSSTSTLSTSILPTSSLPLPRMLIYLTGTTLLAAVMYKNTKPYNFLYTLSLPLKYLYFKLEGPIRRRLATNKPSSTESSPLPFEDKYFKEYDEWIAALPTNTTATSTTTTTTNTTTTTTPPNPECLENMYYTTVRETINDFYGDVIMCYDHKTQSFAYYARTGNIPYKYLETISRKYMVETNAPREIHVDIRSEMNKAKERKNAPLTPPHPHPHPPPRYLRHPRHNSATPHRYR